MKMSLAITNDLKQISLLAETEEEKAILQLFKNVNSVDIKCHSINSHNPGIASYMYTKRQGGFLMESDQEYSVAIVIKDNKDK